MFKQKKTAYILLPALAAVFFCSNILFYGAGKAQAAPARKDSGALNLYSYTAKLQSSDPAILSGFAQNVEKQFQFSAQPLFNNIFSFESQLSLDQLKERLGSQAEYIESDPIVQVKIEGLKKLPNDPGFSKDSNNVDKQWGLFKAGFVKAWKKTLGSPDVVVAVVDTGVDRTHEDFAGTKFVKGYNVISSAEIGTRKNSDDNGHGTLVAGIIAATINNRTGIAGASSHTAIMPIKALNSKGSGSASRISQAIVWAADNGADVINLSLGGLGFSHNTTLANAITHAYESGAVIVAAVGNDVAVTGGNLDDSPVFPVCNDNGKNMVVGVTASDIKDLKPAFANFGKVCVDVAAPGKRILSLINHDPATGLDAPDSYAYASGTSMAAPFVSAHAALLKSVYPLATNGQIRDRIMSTADPIDKQNIMQCAGFPCRGYLGSGRINVEKSLGDSNVNITDGDIIQIRGTQNFYYINGGKRQYVTPFVKEQRFGGIKSKKLKLVDIEMLPEGGYAEPLDGTLVKSTTDATVYFIDKGVRLPVNSRVFALRGFMMDKVVELQFTEVNSWVLGGMLTPPDGTLLKADSNPTLYWVADNTLHPISYNFYKQRGLNIFPPIVLPDAELKQYPIGESY